MRGLIIGITALAALAACTPSNRLEPLNQGIAAPPGTAVLRGSVDGMVVGRRLMEAGEYAAARELFEVYARSGNAEAEELIGVMYALGLGVERDDERLALVVEVDDERIAVQRRRGTLAEPHRRAHDAELLRPCSKRPPRGWTL